MGTITKRGKTFRAFVRVGEFRAKPIVKTFPTRELAKRFIAEKEYQIFKGLYNSNIKYPTLKELIKKYLLEVTPHKKSIEVRNKEKYFLNQFSANFPEINYKINNITTQHIASFRDRYLVGREISSWKRNIAICKHMWGIAITEWGYPITDIFSNLQKQKKSEPRNRRLTSKEETLLIKGNHTNKLMRDIIELAIETGLRRGEILSIREEHIKNNTLLIPERKNGSTNSSIPLSNKAQQILSNMNFPIPLNGEGLKTKWRRLKEKYEIQNLTFHDLRHEALSRYLENGVSIPDVQVLSGHKDVRVLMNVYANLRASEVAEKLNYKDSKNPF
jgi:integrase